MKQIFKLFPAVFIFSALIASCEMTTGSSYDSKSSNKSDTCKVTFSMEDMNVSSRTALPSDSDWTGFSYELWVKKDGASQEPSAPKIAKGDLSNITDTGIKLQKAKYTFTLKAYKSITQNGGSPESTVILEGSTEATLTNDNETVTFVMYPVTGLKGSVSITLNYPKDDVVAEAYGKVVDSISSLAFDSTAAKLNPASTGSANTAVFSPAETYDSGVKHYALFWFLDSQNSVVTTVIESIQIVGGITSYSTVDITDRFYHRSDVSITIYKDNQPWYGTDTKIILKDSSSTPAKEYVLEPEMTGDPAAPTGSYTGNVPDGVYDIVIQNGGKKIETDYDYDTSTGAVTPSNLTLVTVDVPDTGVTVEPVEGTDEKGDPTSTVVAKDDNGDLIVPDNKPFDVIVNIDPGYEIPDEGIDIGDNTGVKDGDTITVTPGGTPIDSPTGVTPIVYTIAYKMVKDSETPSDITAWKSASGVVTTFTVETPKVTLPTKANIDHPTLSSTKELSGWKLAGNTVQELSSTIISNVVNGTIQTTNRKLELTTVWKDRSAIDYEVWTYEENIDSADSTNIANFTKKEKITSGSGLEGSSATYVPAAADAKTGFSITVVPVTLASGGDNIVKVKYIRNRVTLTFKLSDKTNAKWSDSSTADKSVTKNYGATVTASDIPVPKPNSHYGYEWSQAVPAAGTLFTASAAYTANISQTEFSYKFHYQFKKLDGTYETNSSFPDSSLTYVAKGTSVSAAGADLKTAPTGFQNGVSETKTVTADNTVINVSYERKDISITFALSDTTNAKWSDSSTADKTVTKKYGSTLTASDIPAVSPADHYGCSWSPSDPAAGTLFSAPVTYTATIAKSEYSYKFRYQFETVAGGSYESRADFADSELKYAANNTAVKAQGSDLKAAPAGFNTGVSETKNVTSDGTIILVKYDRKDITYTFTLSDKTNAKWSDNSTADKTVTKNYGASFSTSEIPSVTPASHYGSSWSGTPPATFTASETFTATISQTEFSYKFHYQFEKLDGTFETKTGYSDSALTYVAKGTSVSAAGDALKAPPTGFNAGTSETKAVTADNTVINVTYYRTNITFTFTLSDKTNAVWSGSTSADKTVTKKYGSSLAASDIPTPQPNDHYSYSWAAPAPSAGTLFTAATAYTATIVRADFTYKFHYLFEKADGSGYETKTGFDDSDLKYTAQGTQITASGTDIKTAPTGFKNGVSETKTVSTDNTVINVKYDRQEFNITFTLSDTTNAKWSDNTTAAKTVVKKYGTKLADSEIPAVSPNTYYNSAWSPAPSTTAEITAAASYTATIARTHYTYKFTYQFEKADGSGYEAKSGYSDSALTYVAKGSSVSATGTDIKTAPAGFKTGVSETKTVTADNTVIAVKYDRQEYNITFTLSDTTNAKWRDNTTAAKTVVKKYGTKLTESEIPEVTPNTYYGSTWSPAPSTTAEITGTASYTATIARTHYTYKFTYQFEKTDGTYESRADFADSALTYVAKGTQITASGTDIKTAPAGFNTGVSETKTVSADNTVIAVKYDRKTVTLTFALADTDSGKWSNNTFANWTLSGKYGTAVDYTGKPDPVATAEYFSYEWSEAKPSTFPDSDKTYTVNWVDNTPSTGSVSIQINGVGDINITHDAANKTLTAQGSNSGTWTFQWIDLTTGNPVQVGTAAVYSYASLGTGKHTLMLIGTESGLSYSKTIEVEIK